MAKERENNRNDETFKGLKDEAIKASGSDRDRTIWVRDDGAVCFGKDECIVIKPGPSDTLDLEVKPDRCGREAGPLLLDYLIKSAGAGVNIRIPPREKT